MGCPVQIYTGSKSTETEADFVLYKNDKRNIENVLLVIEAKRPDKDIKNPQYLGQVRSYANVLKPPYYVITNGKGIQVWQFNNPANDQIVVDIKIDDLDKEWTNLYKYISKKATIKRKNLLNKHII